MKGHEVYVRQVDQSNYHRVLEDLKIKEFFNIIVDIRPERMVDLLNVVISLEIIPLVTAKVMLMRAAKKHLPQSSQAIITIAKATLDS